MKNKYCILCVKNHLLNENQGGRCCRNLRSRTFFERRVCKVNFSKTQFNFWGGIYIFLSTFSLTNIYNSQDNWGGGRLLF